MLCLPTAKPNAWCVFLRSADFQQDRPYHCFHYCRYGKLGGVDVNCGKRGTWDFEESRWSKEYALSFGRFGSVTNVHFQPEFVKVGEDKEYEILNISSTFNHKFSTVYVQHE